MLVLAFGTLMKPALQRSAPLPVPDTAPLTPLLLEEGR
jgi:hypothetical protein